MRKILTIVLVVIGIAIILSIYQNRPQVILAKINLKDFPNSPTQFNYKVYLFGIFPVGKATLEDKGEEFTENDSLRHLSATAESTGIISIAYPFIVSIDSYLESNSLLPQILKERIKTKEKETIKDVYYDQKNNIMQIKGEKRNILRQTYEPLSAILKLRSIDLDKISDFDLNINTNQKNYALKGVIDQDNIQTKYGRKKIFILHSKIFRRDKNTYHQSKVDLVLLGEAKIPLFIKVFASGALITVRLVGTR